MIQSSEATAIAMAVTQDASSHAGERARECTAVMQKFKLLQALRPMVRRYEADRYTGNVDQWATLIRLVREMSK